MENKKKTTVLYVDNEADDLVSFQTIFRDYYAVYTAKSAAKGLQVLKDKKVHIIIADQHLPDMTGVAFLQSVRINYREPICMLLSGFPDTDVLIDAINKGHVYNYITKPFDLAKLKATIDDAYQVYASENEKEQLFQSLLQVNKQMEFMLRQKLRSSGVDTDSLDPWKNNGNLES